MRLPDGPCHAPRVLVPGFVHRPGVHCGSTALADALRLGGLDLSEPMAFGLGAGLGFYYLASPALSPTRIVLGRQWPLEETACDVVGAPLRVRTEDDAGRASKGVRDAVERGLAPILSTDLRFLPYWNTATAFNGHRVVLAGFDEGRALAFLADTGREALAEVGLEDLERARASHGQPLGYTRRLWMEVDAPARPPRWRDVVADAIRRQARHMLLGRDGSAGISARERFAEEVAGELREWPPPFAEWVSEELRRRWAHGASERPREDVLRFALELARLDLLRELDEVERRLTAEGRRLGSPAEEAALHLLVRLLTERCLDLKERAEGARLGRDDLAEALRLVERRLFRVTL